MVWFSISSQPPVVLPPNQPDGEPVVPMGSLEAKVSAKQQDRFREGALRLP